MFKFLSGYAQKLSNVKIDLKIHLEWKYYDKVTKWKSSEI